jgi:hypothetical protein
MAMLQNLQVKQPHHQPYPQNDQKSRHIAQPSPLQNAIAHSHHDIILPSPASSKFHRQYTGQHTRSSRTKYGRMVSIVTNITEGTCMAKYSAATRYLA